jgi:hypothetical protein
MKTMITSVSGFSIASFEFQRLLVLLVIVIAQYPHVGYIPTDIPILTPRSWHPWYAPSEYHQNGVLSQFMELYMRHMRVFVHPCSKPIFIINNNIIIIMIIIMTVIIIIIIRCVFNMFIPLNMISSTDGTRSSVSSPTLLS